MKNLKVTLENLPGNRVRALSIAPDFPFALPSFPLCLVLLPYFLLITGKCLVNRVNEVLSRLCDGVRGYVLPPLFIASSADSGIMVEKYSKHRESYQHFPQCYINKLWKTYFLWGKREVDK